MQPKITLLGVFIKGFDGIVKCSLECVINVMEGTKHKHVNLQSEKMCPVQGCGKYSRKELEID